MRVAQVSFLRPGFPRVTIVAISEVAMTLPEHSQLFMTYDYAEMKDLCKQFLTLVSGVLVFSVTFGEKIIEFSKYRSRGRWTLFCSWILFVIALVSGGLALSCIAFAADQAVYVQNERAYHAWETRSVIAAGIGGVCFIFGLICIVWAGALSMFGKKIGTEGVGA